MAFFQYPWRFLILTSFFASLLAGSVFFFLQEIKFPKKFHIGLLFFTTLVVLLTIWMQIKFFAPQHYDIFQSAYYTNKSMLTFTTSKISDEYMPKGFQKPQTIKQVPRNLISEKNIYLISNKTQEKVFRSDLPTSKLVHINLAYFPAWKLFIDGENSALTQVKNGMNATLPAGVHQVRLVYQQTPVEVIGNILSSAGILFLLLGIITLRKRFI